MPTEVAERQLEPSTTLGHSSANMDLTTISNQIVLSAGTEGGPGEARKVVMRNWAFSVFAHCSLEQIAKQYPLSPFCGDV